MLLATSVSRDLRGYPTAAVPRVGLAISGRYTRPLLFHSLLFYCPIVHLSVLSEWLSVSTPCPVAFHRENLGSQVGLTQCSRQTTMQPLSREGATETKSSFLE